MEELQRLQASWRGHRGHLTKLFRKSEDILAKQNSITEHDLASANTTLNNLKKKGEKLRELDGEIAPKITKPEDLEQEIVSEEESVENKDRLPQPVQRSKRASAVAARHNIMDWTRQLRAPPPGGCLNIL